MHHLVSGINFQIHFAGPTSLVSIHILIHLSTHLCHHIYTIFSIHHSFALSLQVQSLLFQQILPTIQNFCYPRGLSSRIVGLGRTFRARRFTSSWFFV